MDYDEFNYPIYDQKVRSDEDTEDASEGESLKFVEDDEVLITEFNPYVEERGEKHAMKDQIYREKLQHLKDELKMMEQGTHPEIIKNQISIEQNFHERRFLLQTIYQWEQDQINAEYQAEVDAIEREYSLKEFELKECLTYTLLEDRKMCESDTMDINAEFSEPKILPTRKLRRRPNDPLPLQDRRRRTSPSQINFLADEDDINNDLKAIQKAITKYNKRERHEKTEVENGNVPVSSTISTSGRNNTTNSQVSTKSSSSSVQNQHFHHKEVAPTQENKDNDRSQTDTRIENNKLFYDKKWFHRGRNIVLFERGVENVRSDNFHLILQISNNEILLRNVNTNVKSKISLDDLISGKYFIQPRS